MRGEEGGEGEGGGAGASRGSNSAKKFLVSLSTPSGTANPPQDKGDRDHPPRTHPNNYSCCLDLCVKRTELRGKVMIVR